MTKPVQIAIVGSVLAAALIWTRGKDESKSGEARRIELRFAHQDLVPGIHETIGALIDEYMRLNPEIEVRENPIPGRLLRMWMRTKLVGENAPDLFIVPGSSLNTEMMAKYLTPLSSYVSRPNPYNHGTDLEDVAWKDTYVDGLSTGEAYNEVLEDYFLIPRGFLTRRLVCNRNLFREILGDRPLPRDVYEVVDCFEAIREYSENSGRTISPVVMYGQEIMHLLHTILQCTTQRLNLEMTAPRVEVGSRGRDLAIEFLSGQWDLDAPELKAGFRLFRKITQYLPRGAISMDQTDAGFYFAQGRSVFFMTGSWDMGAIISQSRFDLEVLPRPIPTGGEEEFAGFMIGPVNELIVGAQHNTGVYRYGEHVEEAVDFLQFMTSRYAMKKLAESPHTIPAVLGVKPHPLIEQFMPVADGYPPGFSPSIGIGGRLNVELFIRYMPRWVDSKEPLDEVLEDYASELRQALMQDITIEFTRMSDGRRQVDAVLAARQARGIGDTTSEPEVSEGLSLFVEKQMTSDFEHAQFMIAAQRIGIR